MSPIQYHIDPTLHPVPVIEGEIDWPDLDPILAHREEIPRVGTSFLVNQRHHSIIHPGALSIMIHFEFILQREREGWSKHVSIWSKDPPFLYDFVAWEARPLEINATSV